MAKIIENRQKRRMIKLSSNDVISIVREYQSITKGLKFYTDIREALENRIIFIPEDFS